MEDGVELKGPPQPTEAYLRDAYEREAAYPIDFLKPPSSDLAQAAKDLENESYDKIIEAIASQIDRANIIGLIEFNESSMSGLCGLSSEAVQRLADHLRLEAYVYQVRYIHEKLGLAEIDSLTAASHGVTVITRDREKYLVDLTYPQFVSPKNGKFYGGKSIYDKDAFPVVHQLFIKGYFKLTPETFKQYLYITSSLPSSEFEQLVGEVDLSVLDKVATHIPKDQSIENLDKYIKKGTK